MNWTVGRRIWAGFLLGFALVIVVAALASWVLGNTSGSYEQALRQERITLNDARNAQLSARDANIWYLRYLAGARPEYLARRDSATNEAARMLRQLRDSTMVEGATDVWGEASTALSRWAAAVDQSISAAQEGNQAQALQIRRDQVQPLRDVLDAALARGVATTERAATTAVTAAEERAAAARNILLYGTLIALLVGIISAYLLTRSIRGPLERTSNVLASSSAEILAAASQQAAGANETMAAVAESVATVEEVAQTAQQASERARVVADTAQRAAEIGKSGRTAADDSVTAIGTVREQVEGIAESILALAEQAQAIGEIITTVDDIADQTNLLALNAAVEAARAGETGRGFAVVAGEVRALADESKKATVQVRQILGEIQRATNAAVMATEQGTKQAAAGSKQAEEAGTTIRSLVDAVQEASQAAAQIVASAGQQTAGMTQIRQAVSSIHEATQQNLAAARQTEEAARNLSRMGSSLVELVGTTEKS